MSGKEYCRDKTEEEMRRTPSMLEDRYKENDMEIEKRIKEIKELVESGRETQEGIAVPDNGEYEYILYELFEDKNIENGYADALIGFNREKMGEWKDIINKYNNAFLKSYRYFVYDKGNKRFMTVEEMEEK